MLSIKKTLIKILKRMTPTLISSTKTIASSTQSTYAYCAINLDAWNGVIVRCFVNNVQQHLYFTRELKSYQTVIDRGDTGYFRGNFIVDWDNNRVGVRWDNIVNNRYDLIYFQQVIGLL